MSNSHIRANLGATAMRRRRFGACRGQAGFSMAELLTVVAIMGFIAVASAVAWKQTAARSRATATARTLKLYLHQARMKSIHQGVNHFVVVDPVNGTLDIFEDTGTTVGSFDDDDPRVARRAIGAGTELGLPAGISSLTNPLDSTSVTSGWDLPLPDSSARWGSTLRGVMTTPTGLIQSAEATPESIGTGLVVFSTQDTTTAVGIRGLEGSVRSYELFDGKWREI
jgi:prepilin-type N-terminal cleavage/methylation domain-containing protein